MASVWSVRLTFILLIVISLGSASAVTKPFLANSTYIANSTHAVYSPTSAWTNPWASGPCYAPGTTASAFCSCSKLYDALAQLQTFTTTGTPPEGGLVWTDTYTASTITEKSYTPPMACCSKTCEIYASAVQIIYWHVNTNTKNMSTTAAPASSLYTTVAGNNTYISPSVYVAYHGLNAYYDCGYFSSFTTGAVYDTTIAYPPDALSTYVGPLWMPAQTGPEPDSLFQRINYTEFQAYVANTANAGYSKNLKIPSDLAGIDPAWSTCTPGMYGSWDPPRVLTAAQNMVDPTAAQPAIDPSATAAPAAGIASTDVPAAPTPPPKDTTTGPLESDPPSASADPSTTSEVSQSEGSGNPVANGLNSDPQSVSAGPNPKSESSQSKGNSDPAANGAVNSDPSSASAGPDSGSESKGSSDPAGSVGQADDTSKAGNAGENGTPASKQSQETDSANQQDGSENTPPSHTSPGVSSPVTGGTGDENNSEVGAPGLNVSPQGSQNSPISSPWATKSPLSPNPVILASPTPLTVGGSTIEKATNGGAVIGVSTYTAGYEGKLSGMAISVGVDNIVIGTTTHALPTSTPVLIGGQSMVKAANGGVAIGTSTYPPGSQAQFSGQALSVGVNSVVVGGTSYAIPTPSTPDTILVDKSPVSRGSNGGAIVGGTTIGLGSQTSINGHVISVGASTVVLDGTSYALPSSAGAILQSSYPQSESPVTLINGAVLTPGGNAATVSGTTYAIPSDDSGLIVNGQTVPFPTKTVLQSVFTVAGQTFTAAPTGFAIGGQSVAPGGTAATVNGTVISLGASGVQIGSKTMPLTSAQTTEGGLGGFIMSGFGSGAQPGVTAGGGNGSSVLAFTGDSSKLSQRSGIIYLAAMIMIPGMATLLA